MVKYTFYYFDIRGRGECIRQLLKLCNVEFEDRRIGRITSEEWIKLKEEMPLGQVPVLEVDGFKIAQTTAILRYLGREFGRAGSTPTESARLDMIAECCQDLFTAPGFIRWARVTLGVIQVPNKETFFEDDVRPEIDVYAPVIEKFLCENGSNGLLVGEKETWVDIFVAESFSRFVDFGSPDALSKYPLIEALITRIHNIPSIKQHIADRPERPA